MARQFFVTPTSNFVPREKQIHILRAMGVVIMEMRKRKELSKNVQESGNAAGDRQYEKKREKTGEKKTVLR